MLQAAAARCRQPPPHSAGGLPRRRRAAFPVCRRAARTPRCRHARVRDAMPTNRHGTGDNAAPKYRGAVVRLQQRGCRAAKSPESETTAAAGAPSCLPHRPQAPPAPAAPQHEGSVNGHERRHGPPTHHTPDAPGNAPVRHLLRNDATLPAGAIAAVPSLRVSAAGGEAAPCASLKTSSTRSSREGKVNEKHERVQP